MDKINKHTEISELLAAKVLNSLSEEQQQTLENWEKQSNNKEIANEILNAEAFSVWNQKFNQVNTEKEWTSFLELMDTYDNNRSKVIKLRSIRWKAYVAAAVLLLGLATFTIYKNSFTTSPVPVQTPEIANIAPGSPHAQLILSNGEVVDLGKTSKKSLNEGEVTLENLKGVLQYENSKDEESLIEKTNTLRVPRGGEYQLVLSDGTKVWLNSDSELTYAVQFTAKERRVSLKGEAYFEVAHNKEVPFIVSSNNQDIKVLGTEFNVSAYPEDNNITTTLVKGKVKISGDQVNGDVFLLPNEQSIFNKKTHYIQERTVETYPYTAWKDGRFVFENVSLEEFLSKVSKWYDIEVFYKDESIKKLRFTGDLPRYTNFSSVLKIIEAEMSVDIKIENNKKIYIYK